MKWTITTKFLATVLFIGLTMAGVKTYIYVTFAELEHYLQSVDSVEAERYSLLFEIEALKVGNAVREYVVTKDDELLNLIEKSRLQSALLREKLRIKRDDGIIIGLLDAYENILDERIALADQIVSLVQANASSSQITPLLRERSRLDAQASLLVDDIERMVTDNFSTYIDQHEILLDTFKNTRAIASTIFFSTTLVTIFVTYLLAYSVTSRVNKLSRVSKEISKGNMKARLDPYILESHDEIGQLARAFDRLLTSLKLALSRSTSLTTLSAHHDSSADILHKNKTT